MLMYMFHIAFGIGLIALVMGLCMCKSCCCCKSGSEGATCTKSHCGKWCGIIISILAIISLVCTVNTAYKQMNSGMMEMDKMFMKMKEDMMKKEMEAAPAAATKQ